jgi:hypothetical protein
MFSFITVNLYPHLRLLSKVLIRVQLAAWSFREVVLLSPSGSLDQRGEYMRETAVIPINIPCLLGGCFGIGMRVLADL